MKLKKPALIILIFLMLFLCIGSVSALENQTDDSGGNEVIGIGESLGNPTDESVDNGMICAPDDGSFKSLKYKIGNASDGSVIYLENDYLFDDSADSEGITISQNITIYGNNYTIDAQGHGRIFNITHAKTVNLYDITFKNGNSDKGGAIYVASDFSGILNATFINNTAKSTGNDKVGGGAIYVEGSVSGNLTGTFENNRASYDYVRNSGGGAIYIMNGVSGNLTGTFINNSAKDGCPYSGGGAIYINSGGVSGNLIGTFENNHVDFVGADDFWVDSGGGAIHINRADISGNLTGTFINNTANAKGGAIYMRNGDISGNLIGTFVNNTASRDGGAISANYFTFSGNLTGTFVNNTASRDGGAIYLGYADSPRTLKNCNFTDNHARKWAGAVYIEGEGNVANCNFTGNKVTGSNSWGGAIYMSYGSVENCNFTNNTATNGNGGAIRMYSGSVTNCNFTANQASGDGGAVYFDSNGNVTNCNFTGNNATTGSAIYFYLDWDTKTVSNSCFLNNRANAEALEVTKNENNITITFTGQNNLLNAIYSRFVEEFTFTNVTYWGAKGIANTDSSTPVRFNREAGQNITVEIYDSKENLVDNVTLVTDDNGQVTYDLSELSNDNYTCNVYHIEDCYYTYAEYKDVGDFNRLQRYINGADANSVLTLYRDYTFTIGKDENLTDGIVIDKQLTINGNGHTINALEKARIFYVTASSINITGLTFKNGKANNGGAIYFKNAIYNSNINASFINNTATDDGGANYFWYLVSESTIAGTYTNNNATGYGGANYFNHHFSYSTIAGTYTNNTGKWGGANYFFRVSGSNVTGTYTNNTGKWGGANYFRGLVSDLNIGGTYINNSAAEAIIHFEDYMEQGLNVQINYTIFLNNKCDYEIYVRTQGVVVKDSWFGNNESNFMNKPNVNKNVKMDNWLFLNATADYNSILIMDSTNITFKLNSTNGNNVFVFNNSKLPPVNLTLTATNGDVDKTTTLDNIVKYVATEYGKGSVTAKIENAQYTIYFDILRNFNLSASANNITYLENEILTLTYNNTATGKVNITLKSKNYTKTIERDINQTIAISDLPAGEYDVTIKYLGDNVFSNATAYANFTVKKIITEVILDNETIDLFVDNEYNITYTLKPENALGNISFSSDDSNIVSVNSTSGYITAKGDGSANITVSFSGSENYTASNATITVNVKKIPTQITVNSSHMDMNVNGEADIGATLTPGDAGNLTYKSSDENIVKVEDGKIIALKEGNATITLSFKGDNKYATAENKTINVTVSLNDASISVNNKTLDLLIDGTFTIVATTTPEGVNVTFVQDDSGVYIVDENGVVTALKNGTGSVLVKVGGDGVYAENSTIVNVTVSKVPTEITVLNDTLVLEVLDEVVTGASLTPPDAGNLTYSISNPSVVKVEDGKIIALAEGEAVITVSFEGDKKYLESENKTISVTVNLKDVRVDVNNKTLDLLIDDTFTIVATTAPEGLPVTYMPDNSGVVIVDDDGVVTALKEGTALIIVNVGGDGVYAENSTAVSVTVSKVPTNITVDSDSLDLFVGDETIIVATLTPADAGNVSFKSSDDSIVIVDEKGNVIANGKGQAIITVSFAGDNKYLEAENKTINVTVKKLNATMDISAGEITEGENATISVTLPGDAAGNVSTTVNGKTYSSEVKDGKAVITVPDLLKGDYTLPITYSGDDKYNPLTKDVNIAVEGGKAIISAPDLVKYYSGSERFVVNLTYAKGSPAANKAINITINGVTYSRTTDENGTASLNINLGAGKYDVNVKADDVTADSVVTVLSTINASDVESKSKNLVFTATFIDGTGNPLTDGTLVTFNVKGVIYNSTVKGGKGSASIDLTLDSGRYIITSFNPVSGENASNNIAVNLKDVDMSIMGDEITVGENATIGVTLPSDATGNVTASVNGKSYQSKVNGGKANIIIPGLGAGNYSIPVTYSGDDKYNSASGETNVTVIKADAAMTIDAPAITEGENATVTVSLAPDATGSVTIGNESVPVKDGTASAVLTDLPVGTNTVPVTYSGDDKYNPVETSADIIVNEKPVPAKENLTIKATADEITEGENATVIITGLENATGNVSASVNGKTYTAPINNGQATITVPGLSENATASINYPGDDKYNPAMTTVNITVNRNTVTITAQNLTKFYKDPQKFTVTVTDAKGQVAPNKTVDITINGVTYKRTTDENGTASLNINLGAGEYPVSVAVDDVVVNSTVIVKATIDALDVVKMFRNDTQYYARFGDANGTVLANTNVSFNINGIIYNRTTDANGTAKMNINMAAGDYIVTATNPVTGEMKSNSIKVISLIESDDLTKYYRNASQFVVRIHSDDGAYVGAGEEVTFNINGVFYTRTTNATGHAKLNINLPQGNYTITTYYKNCSQGNDIAVLPILSADDLVMKYKDGSQFKAKLLDGQGKAYADQSVQFNINGVLYNRVTGSDGVAKLNINLMAGEYIITSSYNSFKIANKITIKS